MLCAGSIRAKNVKNVILWNLLDSCGGGIAFWATGYAFAYGGDNSDATKTFVGNQGFFLKGDNDINLEFWFFQFAFACAVSSIVAGTIAERTQMKAYLLYSITLVGFVYPVVAHAFWSTNGFLSAFSSDPLFGAGIIDLAGSGAVHSKFFNLNSQTTRDRYHGSPLDSYITNMLRVISSIHSDRRCDCAGCRNYSWTPHRTLL